MDTNPMIEGRVRRTKKKQLVNHIGKFLMVVVPALLSYLAARSEAESEAKSHAKAKSQEVESKAEAGYLEMVVAAKHLDEESKAIRIYIGKLEGRIELLEAKVARLRGEKVRSQPGLRMGAAVEEQEPLELPDDLDDAAAKHGQ